VEDIDPSSLQIEWERCSVMNWLKKVCF